MMEKGRKLPLRLIYFVSGGIALLNSTCSVEKRGLQKPPTVAVGEIVSRLASASTQAEAESAIKLLFSKIGVGQTVLGKKHEDSILRPNLVRALAKAQLLSLMDKDYRLSFKEVFEIEQRIPGGGWKAPVGLEAALEMLTRQVSEAKENPEGPNAALLLAIASDGGMMPSSSEGIHSESRLSAVQDFLFTLWINGQFQVDEGLFQDTKAVQFNVFTGKCPRYGQKNVVKIRYLSSRQANCMLEAKKVYKMALKECSRDPVGCDHRSVRLHEAFAELQEDVDLCAEFADPGNWDN